MTTKHTHDNPILVTGAAGAVGGVGRNLTEFLLARGYKVRAVVRRQDERAEALHREIDRLPRAFRLPVVLCYFEGLTLDEAALRLRWPVGPTRSRLTWRSRGQVRWIPA